MQPKTNRKRPDRIILFEIGVICALLFVNYMLNFQYSIDNNPLPPEPENPFTEITYVMGEIIEPQVKEEPQPKKEEIIEANVFDIRAIIKQVDDLFDTKEEIIAPPSFTPPGPITPFVVKERIDSSTIVHDFVDRMPSFPGGERELIRYIVDHFQIPDRVYDYGDDVKLNVEFVIDQNGEVSDFKILSCSQPGFGLEREAKRIYTKMPKWDPGVNSGQNVKVRLRQPIKIQIY